MEKIPTYFERDWEGDRSRVLDQIHEGCEWVVDGEGVATRKYDGTCVMFDGEWWWARRDVKDGKPMPDRFIALGHDAESEKTYGWEPIEQSPFAKFHAEAVAGGAFVGEPGGYITTWPAGTYELCGPKVQKNPEAFDRHVLVRHAGAERTDLPARDFTSIAAALERLGWEGIVFHHPDGRMAKIKARDFGLRR